MIMYHRKCITALAARIDHAEPLPPICSVPLILRYSQYSSGSNYWLNGGSSAWQPCPCRAPWVCWCGITGEMFCFYKMNLTEEIGVSWKCSKADLETSLGSTPALVGGGVGVVEVGTLQLTSFFLLPWKKAANVGCPGHFHFSSVFKLLAWKAKWCSCKWELLSSVTAFSLFNSWVGTKRFILLVFPKAFKLLITLNMGSISWLCVYSQLLIGNSDHFILLCQFLINAVIKIS